jgi:D-arabinose 1-dehydrogenase-like Zn-dependent alcohol dehydrogenase
MTVTNDGALYTQAVGERVVFTMYACGDCFYCRQGNVPQCDSWVVAGFMADGGLASPGRESHSDATLYISLGITHTKYTGRRQNDFNVCA